MVKQRKAWTFSPGKQPKDASADQPSGKKFFVLGLRFGGAVAAKLVVFAVESDHGLPGLGFSGVGNKIVSRHGATPENVELR